MQELYSVKLVVKRSRFFAHLYRIEDENDIHEILKAHRREYKKAAHHVWALRMEKDGRILVKSKDDSEVGHPGRVLMEILNMHKYPSHVLVVSRVFGGIKLGIPGVSRAFKLVGEEALRGWEEQKEE